MADKLEGSRLKKGVPYPVARVGGPREVSDTLAVGEGVEFFSGVGFSTLPEVPHSSIESKRSGDANTGSCREGDPCSNKFLFSVYEGASLLLLAEGKPLGAPAATEAACAAVVGFSRCFTRVFAHVETVADVRRLLNRCIMVAHEECIKSNSRYSVALTAVVAVRLQRPLEDTQDDWAVLGVSVGQGKAFLLRKDGSQLEDLTKGSYTAPEEDTGYLGQAPNAAESSELPNLKGLVQFATHAGAEDHIFLATHATHANFHPSKMGISAEEFTGTAGEWADVDWSSAPLAAKLDEHVVSTIKEVLLHKRKSLAGITPSKLAARLAKHVRSDTAAARKAKASGKEAENSGTVLGHATIAAFRISAVTCAAYEPMPDLRPEMFEEFRYDAVIVGQDYDVWKQIAALSPTLTEGLALLESTPTNELHLYTGVPVVSVKQAGRAALEISVRSDEDESHRVAKWNSGIRLALEKGSSKAHLRNCYVDIMQSAGLDAQTSTKAADSLVGGTAKCATVSGERKILSFSQFGEAFRILLGEMEVEQTKGTIMHGRGDTATAEECTIIRIFGSKPSAMEGFVAKLQIPPSARETITQAYPEQ